MDVQVIENYEQVNKKNIHLFATNHKADSSQRIYTCVICGGAASIDDSISNLGHRLMHQHHVTMGGMFQGELREAFEWMQRGLSR